jgi:hypothetical protein
MYFLRRLRPDSCIPLTFLPWAPPTPLRTLYARISFSPSLPSPHALCTVTAPKSTAPPLVLSTPGTGGGAAARPVWWGHGLGCSLEESGLVFFGGCKRGGGFQRLQRRFQGSTKMEAAAQRRAPAVVGYGGHGGARRPSPPSARPRRRWRPRRSLTP